MHEEGKAGVNLTTAKRWPLPKGQSGLSAFAVLLSKHSQRTGSHCPPRGHGGSAQGSSSYSVAQPTGPLRERREGRLQSNTTSGKRSDTMAIHDTKQSGEME